jgi:hypothetical protein
LRSPPPSYARSESPSPACPANTAFNFRNGIDATARSADTLDEAVELEVIASVVI